MKEETTLNGPQESLKETHREEARVLLDKAAAVAMGSYQGHGRIPAGVGPSRQGKAPGYAGRQCYR